MPVDTDKRFNQVRQARPHPVLADRGGVSVLHLGLTGRSCVRAASLRHWASRFCRARPAPVILRLVLNAFDLVEIRGEGYHSHYYGNGLRKS